MNESFVTILATLNNSGIASQLINQIHHPICLLLLQMLLILLVSRLFGLFFSKLRQPAVIGEIIAGIFLGASVLGNLFPHFFGFIFPATSFDNLEVISKLGLALFMFIIGMELDLNDLKNNAKSVFIISTSSILFPFVLGIIMAYFMFPLFVINDVPFFVFAIFMGISLSITAFPVLARIVKARGLHKKPLGMLVLSAAAFADVIAWCILAIIIAIAKAGTFSMALFTIVSAIVFIVAMFFFVRPFLVKIISRIRQAHYGDSNMMIISFIVLLLAAFLAELIGIHMLFGAFLAGVVMPNNESLKHTITSKIEDVSTHFLLPVFFAFTGLRLQIGLLNSPFLWMICLLIILVAIIGKLVGSAVPAKMVGMSWKDSFSIGAFMNTRGLMELIVLNIGYELGILSPELFAILVLMAIVTTIITNPFLDLIDYFFDRKSKQ